MAEDKEEDGEANRGDKRDGGVYDDDLFSLITVLNLGRCRDNRCIKEYVLVVCGHKDTKKTLRTTVASRSITVFGLLLRKMESEVRKEGQSGFVKEGAGHGEDPAGIISSMVAKEQEQHLRLLRSSCVKGNKQGQCTAADVLPLNDLVKEKLVQRSCSPTISLCCIDRFSFLLLSF